MGSSPNGIHALYEKIISSWNQRDAAGFASCFEPDGNIVGFDGSQVDSRVAIENHLRPIFADHPTAPYVAKVREIRTLTPEVAILRAVAGMVPPGSSDFKPELNTVQTLIAIRRDGWRAAVFQSTPAAWHGRPQNSAALLEELRELKTRGVTVG